MPTIKQLPTATAVSGSDLLPLSQNGLTRSLTIDTLLGNTQPLLTLAQGSLLGRVSSGLGTPETVNVGTGVGIQSGTLFANGYDHLGLAVSSSLLPDDEILVNSNSAPRRLAATKLRSLFSAGSGVTIDANGLISATVTSSGTTTVAGPRGDTGAQGAAGQGFAFRGAWQASVTYAAYDVVTNGGQTYVAPATISATTAFVSSSWALMAAAGATGPAGQNGATGPAGPTTPATASAVGAVKPGSGLAVTSDGTLSVGAVSLSMLAQGTATIGQLLGWTGTGWAPTTPAAGTSYTGSAPISVASGVIGLGQSGASIGQVLTWNGSAWVPQAPSVGGAPVGSATPLADGTATAGVSTNASREDHRHPTDVTRAPSASPVFTGSITLPTWTTTTRPAVPLLGMEGYASDTNRRETYTAGGWVQYARITDVPAASGQLLGGSGIAGTAASVIVGQGLTLSGGTLSASAGAALAISGVSIDGSSIPATITSPYQMAATDRVVDVNKTTGASTKILLPLLPNLWVDYTIIDGKGDAGTNNIVLTGASGVTINGQATFVMNANNDAISLRAVNATVWRIS